LFYISLIPIYAKKRFARNAVLNGTSDWKLLRYRRLKIPEENELIDKDTIKEEIIKYTRIILRKTTDSFSWSEGYENILDNAEKFREKIDLDELKRVHLFCGIFYTKEFHLYIKT